MKYHFIYVRKYGKHAMYLYIIHLYIYVQCTMYVYMHSYSCMNIYLSNKIKFKFDNLWSSKNFLLLAVSLAMAGGVVVRVYTCIYNVYKSSFLWEKTEVFFIFWTLMYLLRIIYYVLLDLICKIRNMFLWLFQYRKMW